ncbi:MAG: single-stranded DNA-binding protein [Bacteroidetes bacterium]|nr:MAG: single-stranded DNA-binding protein [Bacteroidota bacterium]
MKNLRNTVRLIGRLGDDPKVNKFENGKQVVTFRIATDESYKNKDGEKVEETQWHNLEVWGGLSTVAEKYLKKGMEIAIEGRLVHDNYEKDGETRYFSKVAVNDLLMLGKKEN